MNRVFGEKNTDELNIENPIIISNLSTLQEPGLFMLVAEKK
jgi:hypothetical protein